MKRIWLALAAVWGLAAAETYGSPLPDDRLLEALIRIPSVSADVAKVNEAVDFFRGELTAQGLACRVETMPNGRRVLFAANVDGKTPDVLLSAHLDVVPAQSPDQFAPRRENGRIYGRGASDCKEHCVLAARLMRELKGKVSVGCVFGSDEEMGGASTVFMLEQGYAAKKLVVVMDSEQYAITTVQKGLAHYVVSKDVPAVHTGMVKGPVPNAVRDLTKGYFDLTAELPEHEDGSWRDIVSLVNVSGGSEHAELKLCLRVTDAASWTRYEELIRQKLGGTLTCLRKGDPVYVDESHPLLLDFRRRLRERWPERNVDFYRLNSSTDARHLQRLKLPMLIIGVDARGAHAKSEYVILQSIDEHAELIGRFLEDHFRGSGSPEPQVKTDALGTVAAKLTAARQARAAGESGTITIRMPAGVHRLSESLDFSEDDHDLVFAGEKGAVLSGGLDVGGWTDTGKGWWEAAVPAGADGRPAYFEELWVNGRRAERARFPNAGGYLDVSEARQAAVTNGTRVAYENTVRLADGALAALGPVSAAELETAQACCVSKWSFARLKPQALDAAKGELRVVVPSAWRAWNRWAPNSTVVFFENVRSAFDAPGEWFYDRPAGKVLYRPRPGETPAGIRAVAPSALTRLVNLRGRNIVFRDLAFEHTAAPDQRTGRAGLPTESYQHQAASGTDAAVFADHARNCRFERCRIAHTGNYAVKLSDGSVSNAIVGCTFEDLGAGGVWMGSERPHFPGGRQSRCVIEALTSDSVAFNVVSNTTIAGAGRFNPEGCGVAITHASDCRVVRCDISDILYTGVSVGWTWGFGGSIAQRNEIAFNRIWNLGQGVMSDLGGVYTLGTSFGTRVHDNVIHDVRSRSYGGWALYTDEGSEDIVMERNLCWNTTDGGFHQHFGTGCHIRNNIFAWNRMAGAVRTSRDVVDRIPCSLHFYNNIVLVREGPLVGKSARKVRGVWANNLWWDVRGREKAEFDGLGWEAWRACGKETGGVFADPQFRNAEAFDFRLKPTSPALSLGFRPWDYAAAGRKD